MDGRDETLSHIRMHFNEVEIGIAGKASIHFERTGNTIRVGFGSPFMTVIHHYPPLYLTLTQGSLYGKKRVIWRKTCYLLDTKNNIFAEIKNSVDKIGMFTKPKGKNRKYYDHFK